jgi:nucleotide-binding universal stress UspA family protein
MYRNILVPLDGSSFGEQALPLALALARRADATLQVVHVHAPQTAIYMQGAGFLADSLNEQARKEEQAYLDTMVKRLTEAAPKVPIVANLLDGEITTTLSGHAASKGFDLVVMTTHGRGAFGRFWLGSVADQLVRRLPMPLLLTRPHDGEVDLTREPNLKHLLLPLDGSKLAEEMVEPVLDLAEALKAKVTLLRVIQPIEPVSYLPEALPIDASARGLLDRVEELQKALKAEAETYVAGIARKFQARSVPVEVRVSVERQPAIAILHETVAARCDLVAVETHGRHGLSRLILGSVADKVIRGAAVPVLVHRPLKP